MANRSRLSLIFVGSLVEFTRTQPKEHAAIRLAWFLCDWVVNLVAHSVKKVTQLGQDPTKKRHNINVYYLMTSKGTWQWTCEAICAYMYATQKNIQVISFYRSSNGFEYYCVLGKDWVSKKGQAWIYEKPYVVIINDFCLVSTLTFACLGINGALLLEGHEKIQNLSHGWCIIF